jgi:hypothetical protein
LTAPNFFRFAATLLALSEAKIDSGIDDRSHPSEYCITVPFSQLCAGMSAIIEPDTVTSAFVAAKEHRSFLF